MFEADFPFPKVGSVSFLESSFQGSTHFTNRAKCTLNIPERPFKSDKTPGQGGSDGALVGRLKPS